MILQGIYVTAGCCKNGYSSLAPFAKPRLRRSPLLRSSFLLIKWRSLRDFLYTDSHASMESAYKKPQVNCNKNIVERDELLGLSCSFFVVYCIKWKLVHRFRNNYTTHLPVNPIAQV